MFYKAPLVTCDNPFANNARFGVIRNGGQALQARPSYGDRYWRRPILTSCASRQLPHKSIFLRQKQALVGGLYLGGKGSLCHAIK